MWNLNITNNNTNCNNTTTNIAGDAITNNLSLEIKELKKENERLQNLLTGYKKNN